MWTLAAAPWAWLLLFGLFVLRARLALGRWPAPYQPDPKDLGFEFHHAAIVAGIPLMFTAVLCVTALTLLAADRPRRPWLLPATAMAGLVAATSSHVWIPATCSRGSPIRIRRAAYTASMVLLDEAGLGRSATRIVSAGALSPLVEHFWIHEGPYSRKLWRIVPDSSGYLIFSMGNRACGAEAQLFVVGARSRHADIDVEGRYLTVAARLRPGALAILTRVPASELTDRSVAFAEMTGRPARELLDRMSSAAPIDAQDAMATFLSRRFSCVNPHRLELGRLLTQPSTVAALAATIGISTRSLYERSQACIGLAPKRALRIARLHRALRLADGGGAWSAVAAASGFADQAHLTREMQSLLGEGPTDWARRGWLADSFKTRTGEKR